MSVQTCIDKFGCPPNVCPDFTIKRHDTKPPFRVSVEDCDGALDLTDETLIVEMNMWAKGRIKTAITDEDAYFALADDIGFNQIMVGDIIVMDRVRSPEQMLVTGFDETNKLVQVERAYGGTSVSAWKRGASLRIFRAMNVTGEISIVKEDIIQPDGTTLTDQVIETHLVYEWNSNDTCLPGCYWVEFKLLKMIEDVDELAMLAITPSFTPSTLSASDFGCSLGTGVEWVRRFPSGGEGFLIRIIDSPTAE